MTLQKIFFEKQIFSQQFEVWGVWSQSHLEDFCHLENGRNGHKIQEDN